MTVSREDASTGCLSEWAGYVSGLQVRLQRMSVSIRIVKLPHLAISIRGNVLTKRPKPNNIVPIPFPPTQTNISRYTSVTPASPSALQAAATISVVAVAVCSATLQYYGGGLLSSLPGGGCDGCNTIDHAVAVVGYNTTLSGAGDFSTDTQNYWIVKNSWGTGWGDNGYAYFAMSGGSSAGRSNAYGPCNILSESYYVPPSSVSVTATPQPPAPPGSRTGSVGVSPPSPPPQAAGHLPRFGALLCFIVCAVTAAVGLL